MKPAEIRFGTDGWRAIIAEEFTFENVRALSAALALHLKSQPNREGQPNGERGVFVGYDTRFLSREFARVAAQVMIAHGVPAKLSNAPCPTPAAQWAVRSQGLASGVMITASHNPWSYNGFKFFTSQGGPADKAATLAVETVLQGEGFALSSLGAELMPEEFDPRPLHLEQLKSVVDFDLLKRQPGRAVFDAVYGTGANYTDALLRECGWDVTTIRAHPDPLFGGQTPDPALPECHRELQEVVKREKADLGIANDPDADRFGVVDGDGTYLSPNQVLPLIYAHLLETRGWRGPVARSVATTAMLDAIAARFGQKVIQTPVGFKWVGAAIENEGATLGGEESGGLSVRGHLPGKDGVLADLLVCEVWASQKRPLGERFATLQREYGAWSSSRDDLHLGDAAKMALMNALQNEPPREIAGSKVKNVVTLDGVRLELEDGSWILGRASGTEPLVRLYSEAPSPKRLSEVALAAKEWALQTR